MPTTSRRAFTGGSIAAALSTLLPSWQTFQPRKQIDLTPFCDDSHWSTRRYDLRQPFAQDGRVYATDARICVRTTLADAPQLGDGVRLPAASQLPWVAEANWQPWPRLKLFADGLKRICPHCRGKGGHGNVQRCFICDGDGDCAVEDVTRRDGYRLEPCRNCFGSGYTSNVRCDYCRGQGHTERPALQPIGDLVIGGQYDRIIRDLGDVEFTFCDFGCGSQAIQFRSDGIEGLLMPMDVQQPRGI